MDEGFTPLALAKEGFGGGLNFSTHPIALQANEWSWSDGFLAKDGYAEVLPAYTTVSTGSFLAGGYTIQGLAPNLFDQNQAVLVGAFAAGGAFKLYKLSDNATTNEITLTADSQGGATALNAASSTSVFHTAFLNGFQVGTCGAVVGSYGLFRFNLAVAGTNYVSIVGPSGGAMLSSLKGEYLQSFAGHLVLGGTGASVTGSRTVSWSASNDTDTWTPAVANDADTFALDDAVSGLTGVDFVNANTLALLTREATYGLISTGGIPAFTRQLVFMRGCLDYAGSAISTPGAYGTRAVRTPYGLFFRGRDNFYLGDTPLPRKTYSFYAQREQAALPPPQFWWHGGRGVVIVPSGGTNPSELLLFDPLTGAWSRQQALQSTAVWRHAVISDNHSGANTLAMPRSWVAAANNTIAVESATGSPHVGAFVDTKDFDFGDPTSADYVNRIKVDWEPLSNATTDALDVLAYARSDLSPTILGTSGANMDLSSQFVLQGTLTGGNSELPLQLRGKYVRFRFRQNSGRVRIRGFAPMARRGSTR